MHMARDETERTVAAHYSRDGLVEIIERALRGSGVDPAHTTVEQLAPLDHFHSYGVAGTRELMRLAGIQRDDRVLDVGGGIGGPARMLASQVGCPVTVLDLSADFCAAGEALTEWTHLTDRVTFVVASALAMPFADASFEVAWTIHASMSIADKPRLYAEIARILRPGGRFAFYDTIAGPNPPPIFPLPWADDPSYSFLLSPDAMRAQITAAGFAERAWEDGQALTATLAAASPQIADPSGAQGVVPPSFATLMGDDTAAKMRNAAQCTREGRTLLAIGVFERV
jgi:SAM-dependent methyltransferase